MSPSRASLPAAAGAAGWTSVPVHDAGWSVACASWGGGDEVLLGLHGGPGGDHRYISRIADLASERRRVVLFDQLGSGRSDRPDDPSLWRIERFAEEVERVRTGLGLGRVHLYGQSWGGWLALQYALDHPDGVASLVLSNASASIRAYNAAAAEQLAALTDEDRRALDEPESPEALRVQRELFATHTRRARPFTLEQSVLESYAFDHLFDDVGPAYDVMWGSNEFCCTGTLRHWDVTDRLGEIAVPTLVLGGRFDSAAPPVQQELAAGIAGAELTIFEDAGHLPMLEAGADAYLDRIARFLDARRPVTDAG